MGCIFTCPSPIGFYTVGRGLPPIPRVEIVVYLLPILLHFKNPNPAQGADIPRNKRKIYFSIMHGMQKFSLRVQSGAPSKGTAPGGKGRIMHRGWILIGHQNLFGRIGNVADQNVSILEIPLVEKTIHAVVHPQGAPEFPCARAKINLMDPGVV